MLKYIMLLLCCFMVACGNPDQILLDHYQKAASKLNGIESGLINKYDDKYDLDLYKPVLYSVAFRDKVPPESSVPFCDVASALEISDKSLRDIYDTKSRFLTDIIKEQYKGRWDECLRAKIPPVFAGTTTTLSIKDLSVESIDKLEEVAKVCNIAKVSVISHYDTLTNDLVNDIIKECKLFKLKQTLQEN